MSEDPPVIRLVTAPEREAAADREHTEGAHAEAVRMLEEMLAFVRDNPDRQVTGLAIAVAFSDRTYASHLPLHADNMGSLIAAASDVWYRLLKQTNGDPT